MFKNGNVMQKLTIKMPMSDIANIKNKNAKNDIV